MEVLTHSNNFFRKIARLCRGLFPKQCVLCNKEGSEKLCLCVACIASLPRIGSACQYCGVPLHNCSLLCGRCALQKPDFKTLFSPFRYEEPFDKLIKQLKYSQRLDYIAVLGELFLCHLPKENRPDFIIPIPMHVSSLRKRGYNQSWELAKWVGKKLDIPVMHALEKVRPTERQSMLAYKKRRTNLKGAFKLVKPIAVQARIVLFDDVVTTGATVDEASKVLRANGVEHIDVWCLARTPL